MLFLPKNLNQPLARTLYADPPWMERGGGKICRGANRHYRLMQTADVMALPVQTLMDPAGSHCYLWVTNGKLEHGLRVLDAWNYRYVTVITWMKDRFGIGQYFRGKSEQCLFGVRGRVPYKRDLVTGKRMQGETAFYAPRQRHSQKPEEMRKMIERVSYGPYVELFARKPSTGWTVWGDQVESDHSLISEGDTHASQVQAEQRPSPGGDGERREDQGRDHQA